jgi:hypothetical protein
MKAKIEGKAYDTAKAEVIATHDNGLPKNDLDYIREGLYKIDLPAGSLRGVNVTDMPEELLAHRTLEEARTLGVDWGDCYPVCYDEDLTVDDVLDSNSWLLWEKASGEDLVIDDSYEYARSKTKEEIKAEHIGEFTQGEEDSEEEDDE